MSHKTICTGKIFVFCDVFILNVIILNYRAKSFLSKIFMVVGNLKIVHVIRTISC